MIKLRKLGQKNEKNQDSAQTEGSQNNILQIYEGQS